MIRRSLCAIPLGLAGCWSSPTPGQDSIVVSLPETWEGTEQGEEEDIPGLAESGTRWWTTFQDASLDSVVEGVLMGNFELDEAWSRLASASASARAANAPRIPSIDLNGNAQRLEIDQNGGGSSALPIRVGEAYSLGLSLNYEFDLFGRINSTLQSARLGEAATAADVQATALALTGSATDAWISAVENRSLARLVSEQIELDEQLLQVTQNRFATGAGTALDVLQQKRLLEATRAELPRFLGEAERAVHTLNTLSGRAPKSEELTPFDLPDRLPELQPMPTLDVPSALLTLRPDVVAALRRVEMSDRNVATAIAARYPRLALNANYNFDGNELSALFDRTISTIVGSLVVPLIDGASLRAEVAVQRAALDGNIASLQQTILTALLEIEDALSLEQRGTQRISTLESQASIGRDEVAQAERRYVGGVDSYLDVLNAIQTLQALERELLTERASVLRSRASLLRALGGAWLDTIEPKDSENDRG